MFCAGLLTNYLKFKKKKDNFFSLNLRLFGQIGGHSMCEKALVHVFIETVGMSR